MFILLKYTHSKCNGSGNQIFQHFHTCPSWLWSQNTPASKHWVWCKCRLNVSQFLVTTAWGINSAGPNIKMHSSWPFPKINTLGYQSNTLNEYQLNASSCEEQCMQRPWVGCVASWWDPKAPPGSVKFWGEWRWECKPHVAQPACWVLVVAGLACLVISNSSHKHA